MQKSIMTLICTLATMLEVCGAVKKVEIAGEIGARYETCLRGNVLKLDLEKDFFSPFISREDSSGFIGLGKHADAAVHFAANTGDSAAIAHKEKVINFIINHQLPDGYTGFFCKKARLNQLWDIHEMGFIVQGLMSDWELFGNKMALEAARRNVDYIIDRYKQMKENWEFDFITDRETMLGFGFGVARLYAATKDEKYRSFLRYERSLDTWDQPIVIGRDKMIYGQAYGYTGTCLEQLELYSWDPRPDYLNASLRALDFQTKGDGLLINGNGGICECWTNDQDGEGLVGETCNATFNLLFWDSLYRLAVADRSLLGDLMERCIYNALFAAMSEDGRRLRYYTPLNGDRKFWPDDLYCCPNNFRRGMSRLPEYIFYGESNAIFANLYTACEAILDTGRTTVQIVETTDYPKNGLITFEINPCETTFFSFNVRIPRWVHKPSVKVNDVEVTYPYKSGQLLGLPRVWRAGDKVELNFPMPIRTVRGRKRQFGRFAVMRGPVVYALDTHSIDRFKDWHPHDVQTEMMLDPNRLKLEDGRITTYASTENWAVGVADVSVDGKVPDNVRKVTLIPYCSEKANLTYFRAPNIERDCQEEDEIFGAASSGTNLHK